LSSVRGDHRSPDGGDPAGKPREPTAADPAGRHARLMEEMRIYGSIFNQFSRLFGSWLGLHSTDSEALIEIVHAEECDAPLSPARLGSHIGLTSGATTSMLNRLEEAGHITRSRESTDRRVVTLRSSPNVHARADEFFASLAEQLDTAMSRYSTEQLDNFEDLLIDLRTTMANHLAERSDGPPPRTAADPMITDSG
jgi:MarR family transcriptional regulator, organic hydroperoxide resistance regulator